MNNHNHNDNHPVSGTGGEDDGSIVLHRPAQAPTALVLMFHGVGATADDLAPLGRLIAERETGALIVSVQAPWPSDFGSGRHWFSVAGVTDAERPARVAAAMPVFVEIVQRWQGEARLPAAQTVLLGFSQGAIMSLASTQQAADPLSGRVIAIAGRFAAPPHRAPQSISIHLLHGLQDAVIPASCSHDAHAQWTALGGLATLDTFEGLGHGIDMRVAARVLALLRGDE
jgi:phospholipase/carboxylesterase